MSTISWEKYQKYTLDQIKNAEVCWEPYWHVVIENTLHPELYELCMGNWPQENWLKNTPKLSQHRTVYQLQSGTEFWQDYYQYIMDYEDIQQAVYTLLNVPYRRRKPWIICTWTVRDMQLVTMWTVWLLMLPGSYTYMVQQEQI